MTQKETNAKFYRLGRHDVSDFNRAVLESLQWWQWKSQVEFHLLKVDDKNWPSIPEDLLLKISKLPQNQVSC